MLCSQRVTNCSIRIRLVKLHLLPMRSINHHSHKLAPLQDLFQHLLPLIHALQSAHLDAISRDLLSEQEVRHFSQHARQRLVALLHCQSRLWRRRRVDAAGSGRLCEHLRVGDVLGTLEIPARQRLHQFLLLALRLCSFNEAVRIEGVDHPAIGVQLDAGFQPRFAQRIVFRVRVLLGVAKLSPQVVIQAFTLLRNVGIEENRMKADSHMVLHFQFPHSRLQVGLADERKGTSDVGQEINLDFRRAVHNSSKSWLLQGQDLRKLLEAFGVHKLNSRFR
mmetsp:Transcript_40026/g.92593  ORF Transcript_40026/g.92593 Transcript_40026/m.92593 type:complete len:278 (+) Transcript_40026:722-1555(+)